MEKLVGKSCKLWILEDGKSYFYTVKEVTRFKDPHLTFIDKFSKSYTFHKDRIMRIKEVKERCIT